MPIKLNGVALIAKERMEQLCKHGYNSIDDYTSYKNGELTEMARMLCIKDLRGFNITLNTSHQVDEDLFHKMMSKPFRSRVIIAGSLLAAEIDRINIEDKIDGSHSLPNSAFNPLEHTQSK